MPEAASVVFVVPDFLGSTLLDAKGKAVWPDVKALAAGGLERLARPDRGGAGLLIEGAYDGLVEALGKGSKVIPFPCDSRKSALDEGRRLAAAVESELKGQRGRVSLVAHGQGGLVALGMMAAGAETWKRVRGGGGSLVLLGAPLLGTAFALRLLRGEEDLARLIALLDPSRPMDRLGEILSGWPGLLEMLPDQALSPDWWRQAPPLRSGKPLAPPAPRALNAARQARTALLTALREQQESGGVVYVAGRSPWTPVLLAQESTGKAVWEGTPGGDGRVPHGLGPLSGLPLYWIEAAHGELPRHAASFPGLVELVETGETRLLAARPGEQSQDEPVTPPEERPLSTPGQGDLVAAALGYWLDPPQATEEIVLRVAVVHGDVSRCTLPVAVGHYFGDTIVSAEKVLDDRLGGVLGQRYRLNLYPGPAGTFDVALAPGRTPPGALVIGLGELGAITPAIVAEGVMRAAVRFALIVAERPAASGEPPRWRSAAFSSLLIGTGGGRSITVEESVAAIVRGALEANRALRAQGLWDRVRIDALELYELFENVAIRATRAAKRLALSLQSTRRAAESLEVEPLLRRAQGGRFQQPVSQYDTGWWKRLQILRESPGKLTFEVLTERARTERTPLSIQAALIDPLVTEASADPWYKIETANTLFELLVPNELKEQARDESDLVLLLDKHTVHYPWELLTERSEERREPLGTAVGLIRQLRTEAGDFRAMVRPPRGRFAFVAADPPSPFVELPGAQAEAAAVRDLLGEAAFEVTALIRRPADEIVRELYARDYQILHLAGHGLYDAARPEKSGMVLGDGVFLTSRELHLLHAVPPFVFVDACFLGAVGDQSRPRFHHLAASLALELIRMGVRALVVAGWAVHDHVAPLFASVLYQELLAGETFGNAILRARQAAWLRDRRSNTWGAYQCYGDPDFVLDRREAAGEDQESFPYVAPRELVEALADLGSEARRTDETGLERVRTRLDALAARLPLEWRNGEVLAAFGDVRKDLGRLQDWGAAIGEYGEAFKSWKSEAKLKSVETLANLEARWAAVLLRQSNSSWGEPRDLIHGALAKLDALLALDRNPERLSLAGSAWKRLAVAVPAGEREEALRHAAGFYAEAHAKALAERKVVDPYPALNWIACRIALGEEDPHGEMLALIEASRAAGALLAAGSDDFFDRLRAVDANLHEHLVRKDLDRFEDEITADYRKALAGGASFTERSSLLEHLELMAGLLRKNRKKSARALDRIREALVPTVSR